MYGDADAMSGGGAFQYQGEDPEVKARKRAAMAAIKKKTSFGDLIPELIGDAAGVLTGVVTGSPQAGFAARNVVKGGVEGLGDALSPVDPDPTLGGTSNPVDVGGKVEKAYNTFSAIDKKKKESEMLASLLGLNSGGGL